MAGCCSVSTATLFLLAMLFWLTGCAICLSMSVVGVLGDPPPDAGTLWPWRWLCLGGGAVLGALQGYCVIWPLIAAREVQRIALEPDPQAYQFFPAKRLLFMAVAVPCCVQLQLHTAQFIISVLVYTALLANVGVFLLIGVIRIGLGRDAYVRGDAGGAVYSYAQAPAGHEPR